MDIAISHFFVTVHDPDAALGFYRDALGLRVSNDVAAHGFRWVTLTPPDGGVEIVLTEPHAGRPTADGDAMMELLTKGSLPGVVFRTGDLDGVFETVRASGAEVLQEPADQPWGVRDCAFRDPSGNMVRISQTPAE
jgi:catechol 2,3-dioxygenase-like lactoylglutathione lyase family enzyme